jgi:hypothetical protein
MMQCPACGTHKLYVTETRYVELTINCSEYIPCYAVCSEEMTDNAFGRLLCSNCDEEFTWTAGETAWQQAKAEALTPAPNPYY